MNFITTGSHFKQPRALHLAVHSVNYEVDHVVHVVDAPHLWHALAQDGPVRRGVLAVAELHTQFSCWLDSHVRKSNKYAS